MLSDDYITVKMDESFLPAIFNGDTSGLSDAGEGYLNEFLKDFSSDRGVFASGYNLDSGECEVTGFWTEKLADLKFYLYEGDD